MNPANVKCEMIMIVADDALIFFSFILITAYTRTSARVGFNLTQARDTNLR